MDALIAELARRPPADGGRRSLVHGDWRLDNLIWEADAPRIAAIIDWELSTIGHPTADLAQAVMQWRLPPGDETRGLDGVDRTPLGIPADEAFVALYSARSGFRVDDFDRTVAFAFFRMAAILQGVKRRALDGNAAGSGTRAPPRRSRGALRGPRAGRTRLTVGLRATRRPHPASGVYPPVTSATIPPRRSSTACIGPSG